MPSAFYMVAAMALLLAAGGLMLWQWARQRQNRVETTRHLEQQMKERVAREDAAFELRRNTPPAGLSGDPWQAAPEDMAQRKKGLAAIELPDWLQGVVTVPVLVLGALVVLAACMAAYLFSGWIAAISLGVVLVVLSAFGIWLRLEKIRKKLVSQLPGFIDSMVRLITIGNSTHAAFQMAVAASKEPLREYMEGAASLVHAGVELDQALAQMARNIRIEEMHLLASIVGLGVRYGGRADVLLERVAAFMRDREQAEHELIAMSAETRLSAWILGLLPIGVGGMIIFINPGFFGRMLSDSTGHMLLIGAAALQAFGAFLLYRLAKSI